MLPFAEHNCGESKLKCIDCEGQICPKCMIQCPVGNRCPKCTKRFTSHVLQVNPWLLIRGLLGGAIAGLLFKLLEAVFPIGGFYIFIFVYFLGVLAGNLVFKIASKLGKKMAITVATGALLGSICFSLLAQSCFSMIMGQLDGQTDGQDDSDSYQSATISSDEAKPNKIKVTADSKPSKITAPDNLAASNMARFNSRQLGRMRMLAMLSAGPISLSLIIFMLGLVSTFLGWNFSWTGFRRW